MLGSALILSSDDLSTLKMVSIMFPTNAYNWKVWLFLCGVKDRKELSLVTQLSVGWDERNCCFPQLDFHGERRLGLPRNV